MPFVIDPSEVTRVDLTEIDFDALAALFAIGQEGHGSIAGCRHRWSSGSPGWCGRTRAGSTTPRSSRR